VGATPLAWSQDAVTDSQAQRSADNSTGQPSERSSYYDDYYGTYSSPQQRAPRTDSGQYGSAYYGPQGPQAGWQYPQPAPGYAQSPYIQPGYAQQGSMYPGYAQPVYPQQAYGYGYAQPGYGSAPYGPYGAYGPEAQMPYGGQPFGMQDEQTAALGVRLRQVGRPGVMISHVYPGSPADQVGLEPGDHVLSFNGRPVSSVGELIQMIQQQEPGQEVELVVESARGERERITSQLASRAEAIGQDRQRMAFRGDAPQAEIEQHIQNLENRLHGLLQELQQLRQQFGAESQQQPSDEAQRDATGQPQTDRPGQEGQPSAPDQPQGQQQPGSPPQTGEGPDSI